MKSVSFRDVSLGEGFWHERVKVNNETTIRAVRDRFAETGRFDAFRFEWKEGMEKKPHFFWDSDVAKWMESVAYIIEKTPDKELENQVDELVDLIEKNQGDDGYFNIYFTVVDPEHRFFNRDWHELYCAGHLTEAAIAYYYATGKDKFLKIMCRYLELIERVFKVEDCAEFHTPGHEEIELALVKLWRCTGEKRWLELSKHFIDKRGCQKEVPDDFWCIDAYYQSHVPCREQHTASGHSVRAAYLYSGMADIALEYGDEELRQACLDIFDDIYYKKLYITGGIGQSYAGEAFTVPYDLPNSRAYTETCAAIALVYFASRLLCLKTDSRFADVIEKAIFNGVLSGVALDGQSFFYKNPLEILHAERGRNVTVPKEHEHFPEAARQKVFGCSCCPPNITRFIPSIGDYIYGSDENTVYVHQFISSSAKIEGVGINMITDYPWDGVIKIEADGGSGKKLMLRVPGYCENEFVLRLNGKKITPEILGGYACVELCGKDEIEFILDVSPKLVYANPLVNEDAGKACVVAGPLVYCAESVDNGENLRSFRLPETIEFTAEKNTALGVTGFNIKCEKLESSDFTGLYSHTRSFRQANLKMIPFFAFANREECDMAVWFPCK